MVFNIKDRLNIVFSYPGSNVLKKLIDFGLKSVGNVSGTLHFGSVKARYIPITSKNVFSGQPFLVTTIDKKDSTNIIIDEDPNSSKSVQQLMEGCSGHFVLTSQITKDGVPVGRMILGNLLSKHYIRDIEGNIYPTKQIDLSGIKDNPNPSGNVLNPNNINVKQYYFDLYNYRVILSEATFQAYAHNQNNPNYKAVVVNQTLGRPIHDMATGKDTGRRAHMDLWSENIDGVFIEKVILSDIVDETLD